MRRKNCASSLALNRKALLSSIVLIAVMFLALTFVGCSDNDNPTGQTDDFRLADLKNPFIGEWQSEIPSAGTTLKFNYKADGTFDYEIPAFGVAGTAGYVVFGNLMVTWMDFEGAAVYTFEVVDNNTINVTEFEPDETGALVPGETAPFIRVAGSAVNKQEIPFNLSNAFIGKWKSSSESEGTEWTLDFRANGTVEYEWSYINDEEKSEEEKREQGFLGDACYIVFDDTWVIYYPYYNAVESFTFQVVDADTISVTEEEDGVTETVSFVRVP